MAEPATPPDPAAPAGEGDGLVLGIDTSTVVTVGLGRGHQVLATATVTDPMAHAEQLAPSVRAVCARADVEVSELDLVVVGLGPGPFTGLRVGVVTARILAFASGARVHGVCTLDVLAAQHRSHATGEFVVASDARRREVYWARYDATGHRLAGPAVGAAESVPRLPTVGPAAALYPDRLAVGDGPRTLDPAALVRYGPLLPGAGSAPLYLRRPDASPPARRKSVLRRPGQR